MPNAQAESVPRRTVLCIDDTPANLDLVRQILRRINVECVTADTGREGLELAARSHPDVVMLDLSLPDIPGEDVLRELRSNPATAPIPIVVVTADPTRIAPPSEGPRADAYLVKPFVLADFISTISSVLRGRRSPPPPPSPPWPTD